jgi:hypothetical protein
MPWRSPDLDPQAKRELDEERRRHATNVAGLGCGDPQALVGECDRHFDQVNAIMLAFTRRATAAPRASAGGGGGRQGSLPPGQPVLSLCPRLGDLRR